MSETASHFVRIKRVDEAKRNVYGEVYAPNVLDTWGEMMLAEDIELIAHRYMQMGHVNKSIDTGHDEVWNGSVPIESFIARKGDPDYTEGAWVLGVHIPEDDVWAKVLKGELNGFSFQAMVRKVNAVVEVDVDPEVLGVTEVADGHQHMFWVHIDDDGVVTFGRTSTINGHAHNIFGGTATEMEAGHAHRLFI